MSTAIVVVWASQLDRPIDQSPSLAVVAFGRLNDPHCLVASQVLDPSLTLQVPTRIFSLDFPLRREVDPGQRRHAFVLHHPGSWFSAVEDTLETMTDFHPLHLVAEANLCCSGFLMV